MTRQNGTQVDTLISDFPLVEQAGARVAGLPAVVQIRSGRDASMLLERTPGVPDSAYRLIARGAEIYSCDSLEDLLKGMRHAAQRLGLGHDDRVADANAEEDLRDVTREQLATFGFAPVACSEAEAEGVRSGLMEGLTRLIQGHEKGAEPQAVPEGVLRPAALLIRAKEEGERAWAQEVVEREGREGLLRASESRRAGGRTG